MPLRSRGTFATANQRHCASGGAGTTGDHRPPNGIPPAVGRAQHDAVSEATAAVFDETRWRNFAPQADFFLVICQDPQQTLPTERSTGFLSLRDELDCPNALHIGDIQLESAFCGRYRRSAVLAQAEELARAWPYRDDAQCVPRESSCPILTKEAGYQRIDTDLLSGKYKMRKTLRDAMTNDD